MTALARPKLPRMTADEFIAWAMEQPDGGRYELVGGEVVGMASERLAHARVKALVLRALADAIGREGLPCEAVPDGMAVQVSPTRSMSRTRRSFAARGCQATR